MKEQVTALYLLMHASILFLLKNLHSKYSDFILAFTHQSKEHNNQKLGDANFYTCANHRKSISKEGKAHCSHCRSHNHRVDCPAKHKNGRSSIKDWNGFHTFPGAENTLFHHHQAQVRQEEGSLTLVSILVPVARNPHLKPSSPVNIS